MVPVVKLAGFGIVIILRVGVIVQGGDRVVIVPTGVIVLVLAGVRGGVLLVLHPLHHHHAQLGPNLLLLGLTVPLPVLGERHLRGGGVPALPVVLGVVLHVVAALLLRLGVHLGAVLRHHAQLPLAPPLAGPGLVGPLRGGHGAVCGGLLLAGAGHLAGPRLLVVAHLGRLPVDGGRRGDQLVVEEHGVHHAVHLDVADAAAHARQRVSANLHILERELGEGTQHVQNRVLSREGIQSTQEDGVCRVCANFISLIIDLCRIIFRPRSVALETSISPAEVLNTALSTDPVALHPRLLEGPLVSRHTELHRHAAAAEGQPALLSFYPLPGILHGGKLHKCKTTGRTCIFLPDEPDVARLQSVRHYVVLDVLLCDVQRQAADHDGVVPRHRAPVLRIAAGRLGAKPPGPGAPVTVPRPPRRPAAAALSARLSVVLLRVPPPAPAPAPVPPPPPVPGLRLLRPGPGPGPLPAVSPLAAPVPPPPLLVPLLPLPRGLQVLAAVLGRQGGGRHLAGSGGAAP